MQIMLLKCVLFFLTIGWIEGSGILQKLNYSLVNEEIIKKILDSCYKNDSLSSPIVIFGDFNGFGKRLTVRMDSSLITGMAYNKRQFFNAGPSKIILIGNTPQGLMSDIILLKRTRWWKPMIQLFIVDKSNQLCRLQDIIDTLVMTWDMDMINSIYICTRAVKLLYTLNMMAEYAPDPWHRRRSVTTNDPDFNGVLFHQIFDHKISCKNLNYDKTRRLDKHTINGIMWKPSDNFRVIRGKNYVEEVERSPDADYRLTISIIKTINARGRCEWENYGEVCTARLANRSSDILFTPKSLIGLFRHVPSPLSPHATKRLVAVVKLKPEVTTLEKIRKIWSTEVLILAAVALIILFLVLIIENREYSSAMLDAVRFLIYTSILTNNRSHPFRIYFTTMLIFMVISNGVFQGLIAAFLTTEERGSAAETIEELRKLRYKLYISKGLESLVKLYCPEYRFKAVPGDKCVYLVRHNTNYVCIVDKDHYERYYNAYNLDTVKQEWEVGFVSFIPRRNWPLKNSVDNIILRHVEAGLTNHWQAEESSTPKLKRQAREAEWSSPQYKPVRLYKLMFAFHLLAVGLLLSTVVFFLELLVAKTLSHKNASS